MRSQTDLEQTRSALHQQMLAAMMLETDETARAQAMATMAARAEDSGLALHSLPMDSPEAFLDSLLLTNPSALTWLEQLMDSGLMPDLGQQMDLPDLVDLIG